MKHYDIEFIFAFVILDILINLFETTCECTPAFR